MKTLIIYSAWAPLTQEHKAIGLDDPLNPGREIYLRTEIVDGTALDALDQARPLHGETLVNTLPVDA